MANFFEGIGNALMHPINEAKWMFDSTVDVLKGDMDLKDIPGSHQEMMNDITVPILGDNKLAKNSDAVAGAVIGGILAAPALGAAGSGGGAPVTEAVGMSPLDAVLKGGGNASEVGSVVADGANKRWGNVLSSFGGQLTSGSQGSQVQAPAFKPKFTMPQTQSMGQSAMQQMFSNDYNLNI